MPKPTPAEFESGRDRFFDALEPIARSLGCQVTVTITPVGFYNEPDELAPRDAPDLDEAPKLDNDWFASATKVKGIAAFALNDQVTVHATLEWGTVIGVMHLMSEPPRFLVRYRGVDEIPYKEDWFFASGISLGWPAE